MRELLKQLRGALEESNRILAECRTCSHIVYDAKLLAEADAELAKPTLEPHLTDEELRKIYHIEEFDLFCGVCAFIDAARHIERVVLNRVLYIAQPDLQKRVEKLEHAAKKALEAMQWNLGGEPLDTLMAEAVNEIKALGIKAKE